MTSTPDRFDPHATEAMARMFDGVSLRYGLLNRLMTLGQDRTWRRAMWAAVPDRANVVLDLCTGDGSSLSGLRQPGRLVIGLDTSLGMLEHAVGETRRAGWAPRLVCGDAFRLPMRDGSVDAVTVAFGVRNLRPQATAIGELARVMRAGATLVVLEATAPRTGFAAPFHHLYLRRVVPLLGRLSPDPSAYAYLAASVLEFGPGDALVAAAAEHAFVLRGSRSFLLGATRIWVFRAPGSPGAVSSGRMSALQAARLGESARGEMPTGERGGLGEQRIWTGLQFVLSLALTVALIWALWTLHNPHIHIPLDAPRRTMMLALVGGGIVVFGFRTVMFLLRTLRPTRRI